MTEHIDIADIEIISSEVVEETPEFKGYKFLSMYKGRRFWTEFAITTELQADPYFNVEDFKMNMIRESLVSLLREENNASVS